MRAKLLYQPFIDTFYLFPVYRRGVAMIVTSPKTLAPPCIIHPEYLRILVCQPFGTGTGWGTQDGVYSIFIELIQPFL